MRIAGAVSVSSPRPITLPFAMRNMTQYYSRLKKNPTNIIHIYPNFPYTCFKPFLIQIRMGMLKVWLTAAGSRASL